MKCGSSYKLRLYDLRNSTSLRLRMTKGHKNVPMDKWYSGMTKDRQPAWNQRFKHTSFLNFHSLVHFQQMRWFFLRNVLCGHCGLLSGQVSDEDTFLTFSYISGPLIRSRTVDYEKVRAVNGGRWTNSWKKNTDLTKCIWLSFQCFANWFKTYVPQQKMPIMRLFFCGVGVGMFSLFGQLPNIWERFLPCRPLWLLQWFWKVGQSAIVDKN